MPDIFLMVATSAQQCFGEPAVHIDDLARCFAERAADQQTRYLNLIRSSKS